ncbi:hypothetical protein C7212DRAFT_352524 [Tuber magnatum]|uniref:NYN domain-containing protein n=1 Tax=Tuber magnatum TaxID=42249 RepID=A0A317SUV2_9PEZI|nr:hypothetical protein C7212DRAFT_352524 [Tuber magnatum]
MADTAATIFNFSTVIALSDALTTNQNSNPLVINPDKISGATPHKSLGDFTPLWDFLGSLAAPCTTTDEDDPLPPTQIHPSPRRKRKKRNSGSIKIDAATAETPPVVRPRGMEIPTPLPPVPSVVVDANLDDSFDKRPVIRSPMTSVERKAQLVQKILSLFPAQASHLLTRPGLRSGARDPSDTDIHVFVDASNILIGFYECIKKRRGYSRGAAVRQPAFSFHGLSLVLERGRTCSKRAYVGSSPTTVSALEARSLGYEVSLLERVEKERANTKYSSSSGSEGARKRRPRKVEQAVDEILHLKILESVLDFTPTTIVLASGDAAQGEYSPGFFKVVERCLDRGWKIELVSFKASLSWLYSNKDFSERWKGAFSLVLLDAFAEELLE